MTMVHASPLAAKVAAVNAANTEANRLYPILRAIFEPFVGQKIETVDGRLLAKIAKLVPAFPYTPTMMVYRHGSDYSLAWTVKANESSPGRTDDYQIANYHETTVYIGNLRDGVLTELCEPDEFRTDYTADAVQLARDTYKHYKRVADDARNALWPFDEYDR